MYPEVIGLMLVEGTHCFEVYPLFSLCAFSHQSHQPETLLKLFKQLSALLAQNS